MTKGKYNRAFTCVHALKHGMNLVFTDGTCEKKATFKDGTFAVSRIMCNTCNKYEKRTDGKETPFGY